MPEIPIIPRWADVSDRLASGLGRWIDRACVALLALLVVDVWFGVLVRYALPLPFTFMEEAARYLMIWLALLAAAGCIVRRQHIGVQFLFTALPRGARRLLLAVIDLLSFAFFAFIFVYGIGLVGRGTTRLTMIYGMTKALPFAAVPAFGGLAAILMLLVALRDQGLLAVRAEHEDFRP
ncbi:MAG: TRAP transporter small permease subunit [Burkholderiaceae bacterium]